MYFLQKNSTGFGLAQMIVAIAIIAILATVVLSSISSVRAKARDTQRVSDTVELMAALKLYKNDNGSFPCVTGVTDSTESDFLEGLVTGGYISRIPRDPVNSGELIYRYYSYKDPIDGECGQYGMINYDTEYQGTSCVLGGKFIVTGHCHVPFPGGLPCSDPWHDEDGGANDCDALQD